MSMTKFAALGAAALFALSGTAAIAQNDPNATPYCSKTVTDNCLQREGHAVAPHHTPARHHAAAKRHAAAKHHAAPHRKVAMTKAAPAPAGKM